jgi:hypothetical protein
MCRLRIVAVILAVLLNLCILPICSKVLAQTKSDLAGAYALGSVVATRPDGSKYDAFGPNPKGMLMLGSDGRYSLLVLRNDLPKFASNNRATGTPEENKAIVQGSNCHYGTYVINDAERTIVFRIENGTYPNWNGAEQRRAFATVGDELKYTVLGGSAGSLSTELTRKRIR